MSDIRSLAVIAREAIHQGASIRQMQEAMVKEALLFYCNVSRAALAVGWQRPAVKKRMDAMGLTVAELRRLRAEQRKLPLKPATPPAKTLAYSAGSRL